MAVYYTVLTKVGKAKIANAAALSLAVHLTHIAVGDGNGVATTPNENASSLAREVWRSTLNSISVDSANLNWVVAEGFIPSTQGNFTVREVGLFDEDGDMIAIGNYPDTYKPTLDSGSAKDLYMKIVIEVGSTSAVTLKIDPSIVLATREYTDGVYAKFLALRDIENFLNFKF